MSEIIKGVITLAELHELRVYRDLNDRQQKLVDVFISSGGDKTEAFMRAGYRFKNRETAHKYSSVYFANRSVRACLAVYKGIGEKEQFIAELNRALRDPRISPAKVALFRLRAQVSRFIPIATPTDEPVAPPVESSVPAAPHRHAVGDIVIQGGKKYRITSVDANGKPLSGDLLP